MVVLALVLLAAFGFVGNAVAMTNWYFPQDTVYAKVSDGYVDVPVACWQDSTVYLDGHVSVGYKTVNGTAVTGTDYTNTTGSLTTYWGGYTGFVDVKTIRVPLNMGAGVHAARTFTVQLVDYGTYGTVVSGTGVCTVSVSGVAANTYGYDPLTTDANRTAYFVEYGTDYGADVHAFTANGYHLRTWTTQSGHNAGTTIKYNVTMPSGTWAHVNFRIGAEQAGGGHSSAWVGSYFGYGNSANCFGWGYWNNAMSNGYNYATNINYTVWWTNTMTSNNIVLTYTDNNTVAATGSFNFGAEVQPIFGFQSCAQTGDYFDANFTQLCVVTADTQYWVRGIVTDMSNNPLNVVLVSVKDRNTLSISKGTGYTNASGGYSFTVVQPRSANTIRPPGDVPYSVLTTSGYYTTLPVNVSAYDFAIAPDGLVLNMPVLNMNLASTPTPTPVPVTPTPVPSGMPTPMTDQDKQNVTEDILTMIYTNAEAIAAFLIFFIFLGILSMGSDMLNRGGGRRGRKS